MFEDIRNFWPLSENLFTGGMPEADQLTDADADDALPNEKELLDSLGVEYVHIPVEWENPTRQNLDDFMNAMDAQSDEKVLVQCQANYRATGFVALYRFLRLGWDQEEAFQDLHKVWDPEKFPIWQKFIDENLPNKSN